MESRPRNHPIKIETFQRDLGILNWEIGGYVMLALGMIILAIPAIKAIICIMKSCGDRTRTYSLDKEETKDKKEQKSKGKYKAVVYTPSPVENDATYYDSKPTTSMARFQEKLDNEISILDKESRKED